MPSSKWVISYTILYNPPGACHAADSSIIDRIYYFIWPGSQMK